MQKKTAEQVLKDMIATLTVYLKELSKNFGFSVSEFVYGEKTAYIECLEWIQSWEHAEENGLNFDVEKRFPL